LVGAALVASIGAMGFAIAGPGAILAVGIALAVVLVLGIADLQRRRQQAGSMQQHRHDADAGSIEFTDRDKETLVSK
jgi:hypothetical protein